MRRIIVLLTVAAAMGAMVVLTASSAVAQTPPPPLEDFCESVGGEVSVGEEGEIPNCTYTVTTTVPDQHGFTRTTSQVYNIDVVEVIGGHPARTVGEPIISCQNPGGQDVPNPEINPNCTPA